MSKLYIIKEYQFKNAASKFVFYLLITLSVFLFISSLFFDAYCTSENCANSLLTLLFGWLALLGAGASWIANPLLFCSWILLFKKSKYAFILSLFATLFSLSFLLLKKNVLVDEAGNYAEITAIKSGYWLWASSCIAAFVSSILFSYGTQIKEIDNRGL